MKKFITIFLIALVCFSSVSNANSFIDIFTIEAEDYIEKSSDNVSTSTVYEKHWTPYLGYTDAGDSAEYNVILQDSGYYKVTFRYASRDTEGELYIYNSDGYDGTVTLTPTGSWETYDTESINLYCDDGHMEFGIEAVSPGWDLDWISFERNGIVTKVEAEDNISQDGFTYTDSNTRTEVSKNATYLSLQSEGDYAVYGLKVETAADYKLQLKTYSSGNTDDNVYTLFVDDKEVGDFGSFSGGNFGISETDVHLDAGLRKIKIKANKNNLSKINWLKFILDDEDGSSGKKILKDSGKIHADDYDGSSDVGDIVDIAGYEDTVHLECSQCADYKINLNLTGTYKLTYSAYFENDKSNTLDAYLDKDILIGTIESGGTIGKKEGIIEFQTGHGNHLLQFFCSEGDCYFIEWRIERIKAQDDMIISSATLEEFPNLPKESNKTPEEVVNESTEKLSGFVAKVLNSIFKPFRELLKPIVDILLKAIVDLLVKSDGIILPLMEEIASVFWTHIKTLWFSYMLIDFKICDALVEAFNVFAGTKPIMVDGEKTTFINIVFADQSIRNIFWMIFLIGFGVLGFVSIITVTRNTFDDNIEKTSMGKTLGLLGKSLLTYLLVPTLVFVGVNLASVVLSKVDDILLDSAGNSHLTLGNTMFMALSFGEEINNYRSCSENPSFKDAARIDFYTGKKDYFEITNSSTRFNFSFSKIIAGRLVAIFIIIMLGLTVIMFVIRLFELVLLYLVSPYFAASIPIDEGEKFKEWQSMFIAKLISGFGLVIMMKLFIGIILPVFASGEIILSPLYLTNTFIWLIILAGGCYAVYKSNPLILEILNPNAAATEMLFASTIKQRAKQVANQVKQVKKMKK